MLDGDTKASDTKSPIDHADIKGFVLANQWLDLIVENNLG
jgi:hypothetical protein